MVAVDTQGKPIWNRSSGMTPELAAQLVARGIAPELTRLYTVLRAAYIDYTAEQIAAVFALIRAEIVLKELDKKS